MLTSPKSLKIIKELLKNQSISQVALAKNTGVSIGQVNKVIKLLNHSYFVTVDKTKGVSLREHHMLLVSLGIERPIQKNLFKQYVYNNTVDDTKIFIASILKEMKYAFTLLAALPRYSSVAGGERISLHIDRNQLDEINMLFIKSGIDNNNKVGVIIDVYSGNEGIFYDIQQDGLINYVSKEQLLIDFFCSPQYNYIATQLLEEYMEVLKIK